jgi:alpha-beta hydrolase superfamily lysophospholipase
VAAGFAVFAFDYRGHGRSPGQRGFCRRYHELVADLEYACAAAQERVPGVPTAVVAHSHGALMALDLLCGESAPRAHVRAAVFSAPYLGMATRLSAADRVLATVATRLLPRFTVGDRLDETQLTHDAAVLAEHRHDTLCHHGVTARWLTECLAAQRRVHERLSNLSIPSLWLIPMDDTIADSAVGRAAYEAAGGEKALRVYQGMYHELFNEIGRARVLADVRAWLDAVFPVESI